MIGTLSQVYLYNAVKTKYGSPSAVWLLFLLIFTPANFISLTSFLPSTFSMYCLTIALASWINQNFVLSIYMVALSTLIGWPFSVLISLPLVIQILMKKPFKFIIQHGIISVVVFLVPSIFVDYFYYKKFIFASFNIVFYNVFSTHSGPDLYGTEPWYFYFVNLFLNFNLAFVFSLFSLPILVLYAFIKPEKSVSVKTNLFFISSFYLWFIYMSTVSHKEERFMFVIYPFIFFLAAITMQTSYEILKSIKFLFIFKKPFLFGIAMIILLFSISRTTSLYYNYDAPMNLYYHLWKIESHQNIWNPLFQNQNFANNYSLICLGKEWYRFYTHFFIPSHLRIGFIDDGFHGQLPQYFGNGANATSRIPDGFNDLNKEEVSRYVPLEKCTYWITFIEDEQSYQMLLKMRPEWKIVFNSPFLDAQKSHRLFRAFYFPKLSTKLTSFGKYLLLKNKDV